MTIDIRLPRITGGTVEAQIAQLQSYIYQLTEQLNWALNTIDTPNASDAPAQQTVPAAQMSEKDAQATFNGIKSLIIKSADIVNAYSEEIRQRFSGEYVAQSDFGTFAESTNSSISANSSAITQAYADIQSVQSNVEEVSDTLTAVSAHIRTGLLYYDGDGVPVYGVEVGQRTQSGGVEVFNKYARFTSDRLSFYDQNGAEVSYVSDYKLYITNAAIGGNLQLGGYELNTANGIAFKWVGRS